MGAYCRTRGSVKEDHSEDLGVSKRICLMLKWILNWIGDVDWLYLTHNKFQWLAVLNRVVNIQVS
jgi:hypothetical protein